MTTVEMRAAAVDLVRLHRRFAPWFGRREAQNHARVYLNGLLLGEGRKSVEPMALAFAEHDDDAPTQNRVLGLQRFLTASPWQSQGVQREIQAVFAEEIAPSAANSTTGVVGVVDGSSFIKKGTESVGVARQWCGRLGKVDNCQTGVFVAATAPAGSALLDLELYLPRSWIADSERRQQTRVPEDMTFRTKPQIAAQLLERIAANGLVTFDWLVADEEFGRNGAFLDALEARGQQYLVEVPANTVVWTVDPSTAPAHSGPGRPPEIRSVRELAAEIPAAYWETLQVREGSVQPLVFQFARVRVWAVRHRKAGRPIWVLLQRSLENPEVIKYHVSAAGLEVPLETLALVSSRRWPVEELFEDGKGSLGMADYEARAWTSWHHHMSLVALAHLFVTLTRKRLQQNTAELTLDMAVRILKATLPRPEIHEAEALEILDYHLNRNRAAKASHYKTWRQQHKGIKYKLLL